VKAIVGSAGVVKAIVGSADRSVGNTSVAGQRCLGSAA